MANLRQVAQRAGVSVATVSRVVNQPESVKLVTRERVERAMQELLYVSPKPNAQEQLAGLLVPDLLNPSFTQVTQAIETAGRSIGWSFILATTGDDATVEREHAQQLFTRQISSMVFVSSVAANTAEHLPHYQALLDAGANLLFINGAPARLNTTAVSDDEMASGRIAAEHLVELGHRHFGYITGKATSSLRSPLRVQGMSQVLRDYDGATLHTMHGDWGVRGGGRTAEQLLQKFPETTALVCASDLTAIGAMNYCRRAGIAIPEDISVLGSDGIEAGEWVRPTLSTVAQPIGAIAEFTANWLLTSDDHSRPLQASEMLLRPTLAPRESTGSVRSIGRVHTLR
ncbi:MAG: LacI family DNA-binding transcriptional regulator [Candidatus Nanopelagicales bacterium]